MSYRLHGSRIARLATIALCLVMALTLVGSVQPTAAAGTSLTLSVGSSPDDARNPDGGAVTTTEKVAQIGAGSGGNVNVAGFRFTGVAIPRGAVIEAAQLTMVANKTTTTRLVVDCAFEVTDNAAAFSGSATPAQRTMTGAKQHTDRKTTRDGGKRYVVCGGAQLAASLQEIVNRGGWMSGNALALIASGPATPSGARVGFRTRDYSASAAPRLKVTFSEPTGGGGNETPVAGQPCPTWVHDQYVTTGHHAATAQTWHPPVDQTYGCYFGHEHGDAPPSWVLDAGYVPAFDHPANTPRENELKHSSFKNFSLTLNGIDVYIVMHLDTNPSGHTSRFHSYQMWTRDPQGGVSHWNGWLDFGEGNNTGPNLVRMGCEDDSIRPIMSVNDEGCGPLRFENWYSRAGGSGSWAPDFGYNIRANYYTGFSGADPFADVSSWKPTGDLNDVRRVEVAWYAFRSSQRGSFYATQFGQIVSGPSDPVCGTTRTFGAKTYTVLCLEQYIAPTMPTLAFPGNSAQKNYSMTGVHLPN